MHKLIYAIILFMLVLTTGCSTFDTPLFDLLSKKGCKGGNCQQVDILDNTNADQEWYCYGEQGTTDWQCENKRDPSKIVAVVPKTTQPTSPGLPQPSEPAFIAPIPTQAVASGSNRRPGGARPVNPRQISTKQAASRQTAPWQATANQKILAQPAGFFAVQLIALQDKTRIISFAQQHGLLNPTYARINSKGKIWYTLLLGIYPDRSSAVQAKQAWENSRNVAVKPWVRPLGALQDAIRATRS